MLRNPKKLKNLSITESECPRKDEIESKNFKDE